MDDKPNESTRGSPGSDQQLYPDYLFASTSESKKTSSTSPSTTDNTHARPIQNSTQCHSVILFGAPIAALIMDGIERLCLAQISNILLKDYSYNEIHNRRVALGVTCVQCTPVQLEMLRRVGAMPASSRRCGMITLREAERLCKSFLVENTPPKLPDNFAFEVYHKCSWGCRGSFIPSRYNSSRAKCVKCRYCSLFFSPNKFIFHTHRMPESKYRQPDAANFNSWRRHIFLCDENPTDALQQAWEDVKAMFNGGNRRRITHHSDKQTRPNGAPTLPGYLDPYACHTNPFQLEKLRVFPPLTNYGLFCESNKAFPPLRGIRHDEPQVESAYSTARNIPAVHPHHSLQRHVTPFLSDPARHFLRPTGLHDAPGMNFPSDSLRGFLPHHMSVDPFWKGPLHAGVLPPSIINTWRALMFPRGHSMCFGRPEENLHVDEKESLPKRKGEQDITAPDRRPIIPIGSWNSPSPFQPNVEDLTVPTTSESSHPSSAFRLLHSTPSHEEKPLTTPRTSSPILNVDSPRQRVSPVRKSVPDVEIFSEARKIGSDSREEVQSLTESSPQIVIDGGSPKLKSM